MLFLCWADVENGGPTLEQHWVSVSCLLGRYSTASSYLGGIRWTACEESDLVPGNIIPGHNVGSALEMLAQY